VPASTPTVTETPGAMVMEIVENTSAPEYAAREPAYQSASSYSGSKYILVDISNSTCTSMKVMCSCIVSWRPQA
jgi:hypothetical protein